LHFEARGSVERELPAEILSADFLRQGFPIALYRCKNCDG
jgi:hypothetical protein